MKQANREMKIASLATSQYGNGPASRQAGDQTPARFQAHPIFIKLGPRLSPEFFRQQVPQPRLPDEILLPLDDSCRYNTIPRRTIHDPARFIAKSSRD
jgi:hypothetical protein